MSSLKGIEKMPKTIIWIEDDIDIIDPVVWPLERSGYHIIRLGSSDEALNMIRQIYKADLILLDLIFPHPQWEQTSISYPGLALLHELREVHHVKAPVIIFTVANNMISSNELKNLSVSDIIRKPVLPSELKRCVEEVLETRS
jgi:CheY-like chemotaxis protein